VVRDYAVDRTIQQCIPQRLATRGIRIGRQHLNSGRPS
jgi:hypothetical protein